MPKLKNSNATFWVIFKYCALVRNASKNGELICFIKEPSYLSLLLWNSIDFCLWKLFYHCKCQKQFPLWEGSETDIFLALNQQMGFIVWVQMMPISPTRWVLKPKTLGKSLLIFIFTWCKMHFIWWHYQKVLKDFAENEAGDTFMNVT